MPDMTKEQKGFLVKKYKRELIKIGLFQMFGDEETATCLAKNILSKEGLLKK